MLIEVGGVWQLAGLADWKYWKGEMSDFRAGIYGQVTYQVRISHYAGWIDSVIAAQ